MRDGLLSYGNQHPRWFEPVTEYQPSAELLSIYRQYAPEGWSLSRLGLWFIARPPITIQARQGWKLHLSAVPEEAAEILRKAMAVLYAQEVPFKFLVDTTTLKRSSAKPSPRGSSGKFITVYPNDEEEFVLIAKKLAETLTGHHGPFILSDRRVPGSDVVFYRYGGFTATYKLRPDGAKSPTISDPDGNDYLDIRNPFYARPPWATDPLAEPDTPAGLPELNNGRYTITTALSYSNAGGVYLGYDRLGGVKVVIKEARPHILVGDRAFDAQAMLTKEYEILQLLADTGHFAQPVELFTEWEHLFLVEKYIDGEQISSHGTRANPLLNRQFSQSSLLEYYGQQQRYWLDLLDAISQAHERGILIGDLSFTNVLIDGSTERVVLIDLEAGVRLGQDEPVGLHTPGVCPPVTGGSSDYDQSRDWYSFGALILGSIMPVNNVVGYQPASLPAFLASLVEDLALPEDLAHIVLALMRAASDAPPNPVALRARIAGIDYTSHAGWRQPVPISLPAKPGEGLGLEAADALLAATMKHLRATSAPTRTDRLFPSYFMAYEANPYSIAYGAAGVLHTLHQVNGSVSSQLIGWLLAGNWVNPELCPPGLYSGTAGIAWVLDELGEHRLAQRTLAATMSHPLTYTDPGLLYGSAGIGMACLRLASTTDDPQFRDHALGWAIECGQHLADTAVSDNRGAHWICPPQPAPRDREPLPQPVGYSTGASGIALFLLYLSAATTDPTWQTLGRAGLDFDLSWAYEPEAGFVEFPSVTHDPAEEPKVVRPYWDEGTAGVATTLLRYRAVADDTDLAEAWQRMRPGLCRKYAVMPQLFHGLAGIGMALLDAAELISDHSAEYEARRLAAGLSMFAVPREEGAAWPSEQCLRESADLATGAAGVALFLHRLSSTPARRGRTSNGNFLLDELL